MKQLHKILLTLSTFGLAAAIFCSATPMDKSQLNIRMVNFKTCIEESKMGKKEQSTFEALKKQMESVLEEKEKSLNEIGSKFNDPDYLDSLSPEAETDLKRKFRALNQEISEQQNQYYQTLQQTNFKVVQKLTDTVTKASKQVAATNNYDLILSEETCFFCTPDLNISKQVIAEMDKIFDKEEKESKESKPS